MFPCLSVINTKRLVAARFRSDSSLDLKMVKRTHGEQFSLPTSDQKKNHTGHWCADGDDGLVAIPTDWWYWLQAVCSVGELQYYCKTV